MLCIEYLDGTKIFLATGQSVTITGPHTIVTNCFGNNEVTHRNVKGFTFEMDSQKK